MSVVRRLTIDDATDLRNLRLESLKLFPAAYASSYEFEAAQDLSFFESRMRTSTVFGGYYRDQLAACASFRRLEHNKLQHKGVLNGMYVRKEAQGAGLADELIRELLNYASGHVELVQLTVVKSNQRAVRFYERNGFEVYGTEPRALKVGSVYFDEVLMAIRLQD